jgi:hypothetical protein
MADIRVTQNILQVLQEGDPDIRVTQNILQVLYSESTDPEVADSLAGNWADSVEVAAPVDLAISDSQAANWNENVATDYLAPATPLSVVVADDNTFWYNHPSGKKNPVATYRDSLLYADDPASSLGIGLDDLVTNYLEDLQINYGLLFSDSQAGNWGDSVSLLSGDISRSYDTLQYNWLDSLAIQLYGHQTLSVTDSHSDYSDSVSVNDLTIAVHVIDSLAFSDDVKLLMLHKLLVNDTLSFSDAVSLFKTGIFNFSDTLSLSDAVVVTLFGELTVTVGDSQAGNWSDELPSGSPFISTGDVSYLRRYLNDT